MKVIKLTQNKETIVDDEDYEQLVQYNWYYHNGYAVRKSSRKTKDRKTLYLHRILLNPGNQYIDHINGNKLDNRKENLRVASRSQNAMNTNKLKNKTSIYKGVYLYKRTGKWIARISLNGKCYSLGCFVNEIDAAKAYDNAAIKFFGTFANLNFKD